MFPLSPIATLTALLESKSLKVSSNVLGLEDFLTLGC
jgi:hypothetical protein